MGGAGRADVVRIPALVVIHIHLESLSHLLQMVFATGRERVGLGHRERRKQQGSQKADNGHDNQQFNQGETPGMK